MQIPTWKYARRKTGLVAINIIDNGNGFIDKESGNSIKIIILEGKKMYDKIKKRNSFQINYQLIGKEESLSRYKNTIVFSIYRIDIFDNLGNIIDAINTHKDGVPKNIREEFDKQFRNEDGSDRIIPLEHA